MAEGISNVSAVVEAVASIGTSVSTLLSVDLLQVKKEVLDLDMAEREKVAALFKEKLNLKTESVEEQIEMGFSILLTVVGMIGAIW